jgi:hypothetical protein
VRGFRNGSKQCDQEGAHGNEHGADEGVAGEGFVEDNGGAYRVEDEPRGLQGREDGEREGGDLDGAADDVRHDEHEHAQLRGLVLRCTDVGTESSYLPSPPLVWRSSVIVVFLLFFEQMRLALQGQADALHAGGDEANDDAKLRMSVSYALPTTPLHAREARRRRAYCDAGARGQFHHVCGSDAGAARRWGYLHCRRML